MANSFSFKLAINNIKQNRKFYLPYAFASIGTIMMFYIMCFLAFNRGMVNMPGASSISATMLLGTIVIGLFAVVFLFYTNSFLMKRRKKEIGLYNILGMEKRHIGKILLVENLVISLGSIVIGIGSGILFSRLVYLLISKVMGGEVAIKYEVSIIGIIASAVVFGGIFIAILISNQMSIRLANPIELLRGGNVGEKEPKTKGILAILGVLALGTGYYISITTVSPLKAIMLFFVAVVLVIIGTYCLFTAGSIAILKILRKNKNYYYKPSHFTAVSGMIYRMKQNAVGLANICILSTMVLVMISTTVCLYIGTASMLDTRYAGDITVTAMSQTDKEFDREGINKTVIDACNKEGLTITSKQDYKYFVFSTDKTDAGYEYSSANGTTETNMFVVISGEEYQHITGKKVNLADDEILAFSKSDPLEDSIEIGEMHFKLKDNIDRFVITSDMEAYMVNTHYIVVANQGVFDKLYENQADLEYASEPRYQMAINLLGTDAQKIAMSETIETKLAEGALKGEVVFTESKQEEAIFYEGFTGGFLFLGIFLGLVFTCAAALIIYYKQISEGYYDKDKFEIMQKVGMSKKEVRKSIKSQVLMVFFIPLAMAGIHVIAAFPLITRLMLIFSLTDVTLFAICTVITFLVFAAIYAMVYGITAREYYKIVG
ncbi:MAG: ABC transporter permease [Anaerovoracaceae bacterium]